MSNNNNLVSRYHPSLDDQQAAEGKLCRFFASFGVDAMVERERLIDSFILRASRFRRSHGGFDLASLALDEAEIEVRAWFAKVFGIDDSDERTLLMTGRAAFLMCGGEKRFSSLFLTPIEDLPTGFIKAMHDHAPAAVPPHDLGDMHHQPYEAWSFRHVMMKAVPIDRSLMHALGNLIRRDGRGLGLSWRNTRPTS